MICTDVAARGTDGRGLPFMINVMLPEFLLRRATIQEWGWPLAWCWLPRRRLPKPPHTKHSQHGAPPVTHQPWQPSEPDHRRHDRH